MSEKLTSASVPVDDTELLVSTAQLAALIILESGGETSRAEETATIICRSAGKSEAETLAFPTGILLSAERHDGHKVTSAKRVNQRAVNLYKVERANAYSRDFAAGKLSLPQLKERLTALRTSVLYSRPLTVLMHGISAAMFTLLFEEVFSTVILYDMVVAFLCATLAQALCQSPRIKNAYQFTVTFLSSAVIAALAVGAVSLGGIGNLDCIIIGSIMPLLPGLSLTNAIRDTVMGDILSGTVRIVETLLIAVAIAGGVGVVLAAYVNFGGGVL